MKSRFPTYTHTHKLTHTREREAERVRERQRGREGEREGEKEGRQGARERKGWKEGGRGGREEGGREGESQREGEGESSRVRCCKCACFDACAPSEMHGPRVCVGAERLSHQRRAIVPCRGQVVACGASQSLYVHLRVHQWVLAGASMGAQVHIQVPPAVVFVGVRFYMRIYASNGGQVHLPIERVRTCAYIQLSPR